MGSFLFGKTESGTPMETRGGTKALAGVHQSMMAGKPEQWQRMMQAAAMNLGFDPSLLGLQDVMEGALADPASQTEGLFASLEPFEARQTEEQVAGLRSMLGAAGGRFSKNLATAETQMRGELGAQHMRTRETALLDANSQRNQLLAPLMQMILQSQALPMELMHGFMRPGEPIVKEGALGGLLSAGANVYGMSKFGGQTPPRTTQGVGGR